MEEKILSLVNLYKIGMDNETFQDLIRNSHNNPVSQSEFFNNLPIEEWKIKVFRGLNINTKQITAYFEYMLEYYNDYFGRYRNNIYVKKDFDNYIDKNNFLIETIVLKTLEIEGKGNI